MGRMLSKIAFSIFVIVGLTWASNPMSLVGNTANTIETLYGSGYICLHISDPNFESSPSFQALARELAKRHNKTPIVHTIGSNETDVHHPTGPDTVHYGVDLTTARPAIAAQLKQKPLQCAKEGYFSNPNNCTKFFRCVEPMGKGKPWHIVEFDCGSETIFDEKISACNHPEHVNPKPECWKSPFFDEGVKGMRGQTKKTDDAEPFFDEGVKGMRGQSKKPEDPFFDEGVKGMRGQSKKPEEPQPVNTTPHEDQMPLLPDHTEPAPVHEDSDEIQMVPQLPEVPAPSILPPDIIDEGTIEQHPIPEEPIEEPVCKKPGVFGDSMNCSLYYQCIRDQQGKFSIVWRTCPKAKIFDASEQECRRPQEINPKPVCWTKLRHKKVTSRVDQYEEITVDHELPDESRESIEHFDEFESSGTTQMVVTPAKKHITRKNTTTVEIEETDESGETKPSHKIKGKKSRIVIPKPPGPKPIPECDEEGTFEHPTECAKYIKCVRKGHGPIKLYRFPCTPPGTIFDQTINECREPRLIPLDPLPECAKWDDTYRPIFEDLLNEEVDEEEHHEENPHEGEYEDVWVDDETGGKKLVRRKKVVTTEEVTEEEIEGEDGPSKHLPGKKKVSKTKEKGHHKEMEKRKNITEEIEDVDDLPTNEKPVDYETPLVPYREETTTVAPKLLDPTPPAPEVEEVTPTTATIPCEVKVSCDVKMKCDAKVQCEHELTLIERLTKERDEGVARIDNCEKQNSKMEVQIKKMTKELNTAKKEKQKYENYIASMDKTIDSYKEDVAWYLQHCPQPTEFIQDDEDAAKGVKGRKRRSMDTSITPVELKEVKGNHEDINEYNEIDTKRRHKVRKFKDVRPRAVHHTSELADDSDALGISPFTSYDEVEEEDVFSSQPNRKKHPQHDKAVTTSDHLHDGYSHWTPGSSHEANPLLVELPLLIFIVLAIILLTVTLLGCVVVKRLYRMPTLSLSPDDFEPHTYKRKFCSVEKLSDA